MTNETDPAVPMPDFEGVDVDTDALSASPCGLDGGIAPARFEDPNIRTVPGYIRDIIYNNEGTDGKITEFERSISREFVDGLDVEQLHSIVDLHRVLHAPFLVQMAEARLTGLVRMADAQDARFGKGLLVRLARSGKIGSRLRVAAGILLIEKTAGKKPSKAGMQPEDADTQSLELLLISENLPKEVQVHLHAKLLIPSEMDRRTMRPGWNFARRKAKKCKANGKHLGAKAPFRRKQGCCRARASAPKQYGSKPRAPQKRRV